MKIILFDGRKISCTSVEFCNDRPAVIVDGYNIIPTVQILRIVSCS